jgi:phage shock protein PspC (stress-responsive transcriptional regulator)
MGTANERPKLRRIRPKKMLGGVCAGFGYWLKIPTWLIRVIWVALALSGTGIIAYILLWIFMPVTDEVPPDYDERTT